MNGFNETRRYDIDWLRTLAFGVLILYHIGMYYVAEWGWHIKSAHTYTALQDLMILTNPWRMSLLFFIAGVALAKVCTHYDGWRLARLRTSRLMVPLLFGMFVVVVPQTYFEGLSQNLIKPGFLDFWRHYANPNTDLLREHQTIIGLLTWNHLWFLPYLWLYSLLLLPLHGFLQRVTGSARFKNLAPQGIAVFSVVMLALVWLFLRRDFPPTNALLNDWYNHGKYFLVFTLGYLFSGQASWWRFLIDKRRMLLVLALMGYAFIIGDRHGVFEVLASRFDESLMVRAFYGLVFSLEHWAWLLCVVGFAGYWLNRPSPVLNYANQAILPWYILHQTLIIVFAWWLKVLELPVAIEAPMLLILTVGGCFVGYEIIRRVALLRWLCGMKPRRPDNGRDLTSSAAAVSR